MPNFCDVDITILGNEETIKEFVEKHFDGDGAFDFNTVIKMPDSLRIESSSNVDNGIDLLLTMAHPDTKDYGIEKMDRGVIEEIKNKLKRPFMTVSAPLSEEQVEKIKSGLESRGVDWMGLAVTAIQNVLSYGCKDWYDWSVLHWGTKWNACNTSTTEIPGGININFQTAWNAPMPVLEKICKEWHLKLNIECFYIGEGDEFAGIYSYDRDEYYEDQEEIKRISIESGWYSEEYWEEREEEMKEEEEEGGEE